MAPSFPVLEFNTFQFYNKAHPGNVISAWGKGTHDLKAHSDPMSVDQLWVVKPDPHYIGYFYIENVYHEGVRLVLADKLAGRVGLAEGDMTADYSETQLWSLTPKGGGYFEIANKAGKALLSLLSGGESFGVAPPGEGDSQQWKLEPRYDCKIEERKVHSFDNSSNDTMTYDSFQLTTGVVLSYPKYYIPTTNGPDAVERAMVTKMLEGEITYNTFSELRMEQWRTHTKQGVREWYDKFIVPLNAYPHRKYEIIQFVAVCTGKLQTDKLEVFGPWKARVI